MAHPGGRRRPVPAAAVLLAVQPLYVVVELLVAGRVTTPYDLVSRTISDLGAVGCGAAPPRPGAPRPVCSPGHAWMNGAFVLFGVLLAAGVVMARERLPRTRAARLAVVLWVVAAASSVATGLAPVDTMPVPHLLASTPVFLAQPVALLLTGLVVRDRSAVGAGAVSALAAAVFLTAPVPGLDGLLERVALWPGYLWLGLSGARLLRGRTGPVES